MRDGRFRPLRVSLLALLLGAGGAAFGADFFVSPDGNPGNAGTRESPWDLATALAQPAAVRPGDTLWLINGIYKGRFESALSGTADAPIIVRALPGVRARIDGGRGPLVATLTIAGQHAWYWGFEVFSSSTHRVSQQDGSSPTDLDRGSCIGGAQDAPHVGIRLINLVLHDGTDAIGFFEAQEGAEIYGNLIYNNGWDGATDRGHGNGMYLQNRTGKKSVRDNVVFGQYEQGLQIYGSSAAYLDDIEVVGNTIYENGASSAYGRSRNILFGGGRIAHDGLLEANVTYHASAADGGVTAGVTVGYDAGVERFAIRDNWFTTLGGVFSCDFGGTLDALTMTGNAFVRDVDGIDPEAYPDNVYYGAARPTGVNVFVRPNAYEKGRAHVTVLNWDRLASVDVDLSSVLEPGTPYEVRNAQDFFAPPVAAGVYGGAPVRLPMVGLTAAAPIGSPRPAVPTGPDFNVFVVLPVLLPCRAEVGPGSASLPPHCAATAPGGGIGVVRPAR